MLETCTPMQVLGTKSQLCPANPPAVPMPNAKYERRADSNLSRWTPLRLSPLRTLLFSASVIILSSASAVNGKCLLAFATRNQQKLSALPSNSSVASVRSIMECVTTCNRDATCQQLIYHSVNGQCYIIRSPELRALGWNASGRWLLPLPSNSSDSVIAFAVANTCPVPPDCTSSCSTSADSICSPDGSQYAGDPQIVQIRHYYSNASDDPSDVGPVQVAYFCKQHSETALRVQWRALVRTQSISTNSCGRYYVTFNGAECSQPNTIDLSGSDQSPNNEQMTFELDGICSAVPSGNITVAINVGPCAGYNKSDMHTGSRFSINTWIWELWPSATSCGLQCDATTIDNIQYQASSDEVSALPDTALTTMVYDKRANDTLLKISWMAPTRVYLQNDAAYCVRWYVTVNGSECTPKAEYTIFIGFQAINYSRANTKTRTLEGYCSGLVAGLYTITVRVGNCRIVTSTQPDTKTGGSSSVSRFIVSEVRTSTQKQFVQTSVGNMTKTPFFNLKHWYWTSIARYNFTGKILSVMYYKISNSSGLHVRFVSVLRTRFYCRWFITINGSECSSPGPIESGTIRSQDVIYHQPGVVDGVCYGYPSENYEISLNNFGSGAVDCFTGTDTTTHMIVQETQLNSAVCKSPKSCL